MESLEPTSVRRNLWKAGSAFPKCDDGEKKCNDSDGDRRRPPRVGKLSQTFFAEYTSSIDRATGVLSISVPAFIPSQMMLPPVEATHYQLVSAGGSIDFSTGSNGIVTNESAVLPIGTDLSAALNHNFDAGAENPDPLFLVLGISFFQEVNGKYYTLKNGTFNALQIVKVSGV